MIVNAIEAMSTANTARRELTLTSKQEQRAILVSIEDSGPGIDAQGLDRLFDAFYTTKSRVASAWGLPSVAR